GLTAVALLQELRVNGHGSRERQQGSLAILRRCADQGFIGELGQELSLAHQPLDIHVPGGTRRSQVHSTRVYLETQLDLPTRPRRQRTEERGQQGGKGGDNTVRSHGNAVGKEE